MNYITKIAFAFFWIFCFFIIVFVLGHSHYVVEIPAATATSPTITLQNKIPGKCVKNPKISFFMYHYVREDDIHDSRTTHNLSVTPNNFREHMVMVRKLADERKITLMTGVDFEKSFQENCFPAEKIWIFTSDDGWVDSAEKLVPIATKYRIPFILWIIAESINKKGFVSDKQVLEFANNPLVTVASHTSHHKDMTTLSADEERFEICDSKKTLENLIHKKVNLFIFPLGKIGAHSLEYLQECWYSMAWSTDFWKNLNWNHPEKFIMNRIRINHDTKAQFFEILADKK